MRIRIAVVVFLFLSACSVVSMKLSLPPETKPVAFDGGGGLPTPCIRTLLVPPVRTLTLMGCCCFAILGGGPFSCLIFM